MSRQEITVDPTWDYFQAHLLIDQIRECLLNIEGEIEQHDSRHHSCDKAIAAAAQLAIYKLQELT